VREVAPDRGYPQPPRTHQARAAPFRGG